MLCVTFETLQTFDSHQPMFGSEETKMTKTVMIIPVHCNCCTYFSPLVMVVSFTNNCITF